MPIPAGVNPPVVYDPTGNADAAKDAYDKLPKWMQEKISAALQSDDTGASAGKVADDDIPF